MMGIYRLLCGMCPEDTSLLNTEVGDPLVVRAIEQQKDLVVSAESISPMYNNYINAPNCCTAAYDGYISPSVWYVSGGYISAKYRGRRSPSC